MPATLSPEAGRFTVDLPAETRRQMLELMADGDESARDCVIIAVHERWRRECGTPDRNIFAELDELKAALAALAAPHSGAERGAS